METSNWIALGALLVALVGLIPEFHQIFTKKKSEKRAKKGNGELVQSVLSNDESKDKVKGLENNEKPLPFMFRVLMLVVFSVASFLVEIIIFSWVAYLFSVEVNLSTMPLLWTVIFFSLFFIPGVFLFLALFTLSANMTD